MLDLHRNLFKGIERKIGKFFSYFPFSPNQYTISSVFFALICFYFLFKENLAWAILFFLIACFLDFIDGAVARFKDQSTILGAYLDTVCDRYVEGIILLGFLFLTLPDILLPAKIWIFLSLFGSLMTTYLKAAAKEKNLVSFELKGGVLSRGERMILILISMVLGIFNLELMVYILIIIAILSNFTALQRFRNAISSVR